MAGLLTATDYRDASNLLVESALDEIRRFWGSLDFSNPVAVRRVLELVMPDLVSTYGEAVAALAAARFEMIRVEAGAAKAFTARPSATPDPERVNASTRAVIGSLFQANPDPETALKEVSGVADRFIKEAGRTTIADNTARDRAALGFRRVLTGDGNCGFCVMVASRDLLYNSRSSAVARKGDGNRYHTRCDCVPEPVYDYDSHISDPDRLALEERYLGARQIASSGDPDEISYVLRAQSSGKSTEEIKEYLAKKRAS